MVGPSRSSTSRPRRDQAGRYFIGALVLLGLVASVFLIFSNSVQLIRVGMVAALWAAAVAAMAATKYRKDAAVDQAKVRDLQKVYELQLDREISARREYEMGVEARVREEVGADAAEMAALRAELSVLRQSLQRLFDGDLPVDRPALRAEAVRVRALPGSFGDAADHEAPANGNSPNADTASRARGSTPVFEPGHPYPAAFAGPDDEPVTAETSIVPADYDPSAPAATRLGPGNWPHAFHTLGDAGAWADVNATSEAATSEGATSEGDELSNEAVPSAERASLASTGSADAAQTKGTAAAFAVQEAASSVSVAPAIATSGPTGSGAPAEPTNAATTAAGAADSRASEHPSADAATVSSSAADAPAVATPRTTSAAPPAVAAVAPSTTVADASAADTANKPTHPQPAPAAAPKSAVGTPSRRRHREKSGAGAGERKLSVAEIMANLAAEQQRSN